MSSSRDDVTAALQALVPVIDRGHDLMATAYGEVARLLREHRRLAVAGSGAAPVPVIRGVEEREVRRILDGLGRGETTASIARDLGVTPRTVEKRIAALKQVVGVTTMCELGIQMEKAGWLHAGGSDTAAPQ